MELSVVPFSEVSLTHSQHCSCLLLFAFMILLTLVEPPPPTVIAFVLLPIIDVRNIQKYLLEVQGFKESEMLILMDDGHHHAPTRQNIEQAFVRITQYSQAGDVVVSLTQTEVDLAVGFCAYIHLIAVRQRLVRSLFRARWSSERLQR